MNITGICTYSTPCSWCTKWDKKCDKSIGGGNDTESRKKKDVTLEMIKAGILPHLGNNTRGLERTKYD